LHGSNSNATAGYVDSTLLHLTGDNISENKPAWQSTTDGSYEAGLALDPGQGNFLPWCAQTQVEVRPWWMAHVDDGNSISMRIDRVWLFFLESGAYFRNIFA